MVDLCRVGRRLLHADAHDFFQGNQASQGITHFCNVLNRYSDSRSFFAILFWAFCSCNSGPRASMSRHWTFSVISRPGKLVLTFYLGRAHGTISKTTRSSFSFRPSSWSCIRTWGIPNARGTGNSRTQRPSGSCLCSCVYSLCYCKKPSKTWKTHTAWTCVTNTLKSIGSLSWQIATPSSLACSWLSLWYRTSFCFSSQESLCLPYMMRIKTKVSLKE